VFGCIARIVPHPAFRFIEVSSIERLTTNQWVRKPTVALKAVAFSGACQNRRRRGSNLVVHSRPRVPSPNGWGAIKFKKQYQPVGFGDKASGKSVEGRRIAALTAAETRRFNQMVKERKEAEEAENDWIARTFRFVTRCFSHLKFRDGE
jgi:hypothetical protein